MSPDRVAHPVHAYYPASGGSPATSWWPKTSSGFASRPATLQGRCKVGWVEWSHAGLRPVSEGSLGATGHYVRWSCARPARGRGGKLS